MLVGSDGSSLWVPWFSFLGFGSLALECFGEYENNGRKDYFALKNHFEGVGAHAKSIVEAENDIESLYYSGEKKPHMWWEEFETRIVTAFAVIDKTEGRQVYSDTAKLRMLVKKVKADFWSIHEVLLIWN